MKNVKKKTIYVYEIGKRYRIAPAASNEVHVRMPRNKLVRRQLRRVSGMMRSKIGAQLIEIWDERRALMGPPKPHPHQLRTYRAARAELAKAGHHP